MVLQMQIILGFHTYILWHVMPTSFSKCRYCSFNFLLLIHMIDIPGTGSRIHVSSVNKDLGYKIPLIAPTWLLKPMKPINSTFSLKRNAPWIPWLSLWPKVKVNWPRQDHTWRREFETGPKKPQSKMWRQNEIPNKVNLSTLFSKRNTTFHGAFLLRLSVKSFPLSVQFL